LWDAFPLLQTFQFPWRFLSPATLAAALLTGGLLSVNGNRLSVIGEKPSYRSPITDYGLPLLLILLLSAAHWGWLYPEHCPAPVDTTLVGMVAWEQATDTVGTTASRELLPTSAPMIPVEVYGLPVWELRFSPADLPEGATMQTAVTHPLREQIEVDTAVPFTARFRAFYFPGWRAWVDDQEVPITPAEDGLITFPVPGGRHTLRVAFGETPLRLLADLISLLTLAALGVLLWRIPAQKETAPATPSARWWLALLLVGGALLATKWLLVDVGYTPLRHNRLANGALAGIAKPSQATFGNPAMVRLLGFEEWPTAVPADQPLPITLYWQALATLSKDYRVGLVVVDEQGVRWSTDDLRDDRWSRAAPPMTTWPVDQYAQTALLVDLLPGTPPGRYQLQLSLFDRETFTPLTVYNQGQTAGPFLSLGEIEVEPPTATAVPDATLFSTPAMTIYSTFLDHTGASPGDTMLYTLFWSHHQDTAVPLTLSLADEAGTVWRTWPITLPVYGPGWWRSQLPLTLPVDLPGGGYTFGLSDLNGNTAVLPGTLFVVEPERNFEAVEMDTAVNVALEADTHTLATLVGYTTGDSCPNAGETCQISLLWHAENEFPASYRVFVHLLDGQGHIVAQSDGIPAGWTRPTTGWLPGEYILDTHTLTLPAPGTYTLRVGMYDAAGNRLHTGNQENALELTPLVVE
jgi:hypothetical protein